MTASTTDASASPPRIGVFENDTITASYTDVLTGTGPNSYPTTTTITVTGTTGTPTPEESPTLPPLPTPEASPTLPQLPTPSPEITLPPTLPPVPTPEVSVIEASVSIKPKTINLKKKGKFKAYIELPSSYSVENIYTDTVECNGALAISARVDVWDRFIAKFNIQDLELNNYGSKKAQFTVSGELTDGIRFEGSDIVKIKFK